VNTLSISETMVVLEGITIGGKSMVKHLETINHCKAILFIEDLINNNEKMSEWNLKSIHTLFLKDIDNTNSGKYRNENVLISSAIHISPKYFELNYLMQKLIAEYQKEWIKYHPVVRAALLHREFEKFIHL
jgi:Fic family protein